MTVTIESLAEKRQRWIDINRENNFEEGIKRLLTELYPDNAHFIYELLQNAEDQRATRVQFSLNKNCLEFKHDGSRLFNLKDIESITSIGASTKRDDPTSIGKFGVGFKAVFAYTNTPEIHSGDFHFTIKDLVVPVTSEADKKISNEKETLFIFPFDHPIKHPLQAEKEIKRGLESLGNNTLLFLNNIRLIEYHLPDGLSGSLERMDHNNGMIEICARHAGEEKAVTHWLRYQKDINVVDEDNQPKTCQVAIAYRLRQQEEKGKKQNHVKWQIIPLNHGQVSIYFPAEKETSNLRFHIHAPFASTVARDSVRDSEANNQLRDGIAELVVDSLSDIRDRKMLKMGFLAVLPNESDSLASFYEPIRKAVVHAFKTKPLTPTRSGTHAPSTSLYRGPAKISKVLQDQDLSLLTSDKPPLWAANPPQQNQREDRFLDSLEIASWGWTELPYAFSDDEKIESIEEWITQKDDAWMMSFYELLGEACEIHYAGVRVKNVRIVRVMQGQSIQHVRPEEAFFSPDENSPPPDNIYIVKPSIYTAGRNNSKKRLAAAFLEHIGVRPFDERAIIELELKKYSDGKKSINEEHYKDIINFIHYWNKSGDIAPFLGQSFLIGKSLENKLYWTNPEQLYIDTPYKDTGLRHIEKHLGKRDLWEDYKEELDDTDFKIFVQFLKAAKVTYKLEINETSMIWNNPQHKDLIKGLGGKKETDTQIKKDYRINSLDGYIDLKSIPVSRLIWKTLLEANQDVAKARYRPNQTHPVREVDSKLIHTLKNNDWIPDKESVFRNPKDMSRDQLRDDFPYDDRNGLLTAIGFGEHEKKRTAEYTAKNQKAQELGFESTEEADKLARLARLAKEKGKSLDDIMLELQPKNNHQPDFPSRNVSNPDRRQERTYEQFNDAQEKEYEKKERSVRTTRGAIDPTTWLRNQYTNETDQMVCQICKEEMPFRKRDGTYYFEKKEILSRKYLPKEHEAQHLALCPLCAAKYDEFVKKDDEAMRALKEKIFNAVNGEIPITLGDEKTSIRFVESHLLDLTTILEELNNL